jgi:hypothetical protein
MKGLRYVDGGSDINIERTVAENRYSSSETRAEYSLMTAQTRRANRGLKSEVGRVSSLDNVDEKVRPRVPEHQTSSKWLQNVLSRTDDADRAVACEEASMPKGEGRGEQGGPGCADALFHLHRHVQPL